MDKPVTIFDVAFALDLSPSTVSRAMNDRWDVSPETRRKVLAKAAEMNYRPNVLSLGLKGCQTYTIGVVIPEFENSFFAEVINGINSVLRAHNYQILICQSGEDDSMELDNLRLLESRFVDGYLVSVAHDTANKEHYKSLINKGFPVVFFNRICSEIDVPSVVVDDRKYAALATEHLIRQGCRKIVHLLGPENLKVSKDRKQGYIDSLTANGMPVDDSLLVPAGIFMEDGTRAVRRILKSGNIPDGLFAVNDPCAIGAMKELKKAGINIPDDIAIIGFSESPMATIIEPNLSSIKQPTFEIGASSARLLLEWIQTGRMPQTRQVKLDATLNVRASSLKHW